MGTAEGGRALAGIADASIGQTAGGAGGHAVKSFFPAPPLHAALRSNAELGVIGMQNRPEVKILSRGPDGGNSTPKRQGP